MTLTDAEKQWVSDEDLFTQPIKHPPANRPVTAEEAAALYPEAMVLFDLQCSHLAERDDVLLTVNKKGRLAAEDAERARDPKRWQTMRTIWRPDHGVWVRYTKFVRPQAVCARCCKWKEAWEFNNTNPPGGPPLENCIDCTKWLKKQADFAACVKAMGGVVHGDITDEMMADVRRRLAAAVKIPETVLFGTWYKPDKPGPLVGHEGAVIIDGDYVMTEDK